ncbi:MAG: DUF308 domain-containing protein [Eubacteriales bacterium]|nr:DUF308 domain-containing protein [Eubacteriales bacterium]
MKPIGYVKLAKYGSILTSIALMLVGTLFLLSNKSSTQEICWILGVMIIIYGIIRIVGYCSRDLYQLAFQYDLAFGILMISLGLVMALQISSVKTEISTIYGTLILTDSLYKIQTAIDSKRFGINRWVLILGLAVLTGVFGMLLIVTPLPGFRQNMTLLGLACVFEGLMSFGVAVSVIKIAEHQRFDTER